MHLHNHMVMMLRHFAFCVFRNKDDDVSKVDVIEEFEDESSTKKKKGKKEKKRKKDYDDDDGDIEDLAKELDGVTLEQGKKDKKQSKVSGVEYIFVCVCVFLYVPEYKVRIFFFFIIYCLNQLGVVM